MKWFLAVIAILGLLVLAMFGAAQMETARAAAEAAKAAQIASAGQAMSSFWLGAIAAMMVCGGGLLAPGIVALMAWRIFKRQRGKKQSQPQTAKMPRMDANQMMMMLMMNQMMKGQGLELPAGNEPVDDMVVYDDDDDLLDLFRG